MQKYQTLEHNQPLSQYAKKAINTQGPIFFICLQNCDTAPLEHDISFIHTLLWRLELQSMNLQAGVSEKT